MTAQQKIWASINKGVLYGGGGELSWEEEKKRTGPESTSEKPNLRTSEI